MSNPKLEMQHDNDGDDPVPETINDDPLTQKIDEKKDLSRDEGIKTSPVAASKEEENLSDAPNDQQKASQDTLPPAQDDAAPERRKST